MDSLTELLPCPLCKIQNVPEPYLSMLLDRPCRRKDCPVRPLPGRVVPEALPTLPNQKALTVCMLEDDGAGEADRYIEGIEGGGSAFVLTKSEMLFHQLRLRVAQDPSLTDKIGVYYLVKGEWESVGLKYEDELRWPVGFLMGAWEKETEIKSTRFSNDPVAYKALTAAPPSSRREVGDEREDMVLAVVASVE